MQKKEAALNDYQPIGYDLAKPKINQDSNIQQIHNTVMIEIGMIAPRIGMQTRLIQPLAGEKGIFR